jgi:uncharacterized membrane protein
VTTSAGNAPAGHGTALPLEARIARILTLGTLASVALLIVGVGLMIANGLSPLDPAPSLDPGRIAADIVAFRPTGFIWLGLLGTIATPAARVIAALVGYLRLGERAMATIAVLILVVIAAGVVAGTVSR